MIPRPIKAVPNSNWESKDVDLEKAIYEGLDHKEIGELSHITVHEKRQHVACDNLDVLKVRLLRAALWLLVFTVFGAYIVFWYIGGYPRISAGHSKLLGEGCKMGTS